MIIVVLTTATIYANYASFCCSRQFIGNLQSGVLFSGIAPKVGGKFVKREEGSPDLVGG